MQPSQRFAVLLHLVSTKQLGAKRKLFGKVFVQISAFTAIKERTPDLLKRHYHPTSALTAERRYQIVKVPESEKLDNQIDQHAQHKQIQTKTPARLLCAGVLTTA
jgi:hypothetical protein